MMDSFSTDMGTTDAADDFDKTMSEINALIRQTAQELEAMKRDRETPQRALWQKLRAFLR